MRHPVSITQISCLACSATNDQASLLVVHNTEHDAATLLYLYIIPVLQLLNLAPHGRRVVAPAFWQKTTSRARTDSSSPSLHIALTSRHGTNHLTSPHSISRGRTHVFALHTLNTLIVPLICLGTPGVPPLPGRRHHKHERIPTQTATL